MKKKIIIFSGDPCSINSEILFKSIRKIDNSIKKRIFLISNYALLKKQFEKLKYSIKLIKVKDMNTKYHGNNLKVIDVNLKFGNPFYLPNKEVSKFVKKSLSLAHKLALNNNVSGIINCPINKKLLSKSNTGVTEFLASKCEIKKDSEVMLIFNKALSVSPITTHLDIKKISKKINPKFIETKIMTIQNCFRKIFRRKPRIAILGLNPHNAENRKNSEEIKIILPTVNKLKKKKVNIKGPFSADTIFINNYRYYDVIVGMYHDQVLAPFKSMFKFNAINITLGLKYIRVSPDHGVATELIGKNKGNETSLVECIKFLYKFGK